MSKKIKRILDKEITIRIKGLEGDYLPITRFHEITGYERSYCHKLARRHDAIVKYNNSIWVELEFLEKTLKKLDK